MTWAGEQQQQAPAGKSSRKKSPVATAGTGIQVVAVLFAVRVGYKLARAAGKLLFEHNGCCAAESVGDQADDVGDFLNEAGDGSVTAEDQWVLCTAPAPEPPEGAKLTASEHLPISVYHFYEQFLSIEATCLQDHHRSTGQFNFRSTRWEANGEGRFSRMFDFMQPKRGVCSVNAHCVQQQTFSVHPGGVFIMSTDMGMERIPYADSFRVQSFWKAAPDAMGLGCNVSIYVAVPFSKRCLVKGLIYSTTMKDCQTFFSDFLAKVQNSITTELLPAAAAQAAAAEQLLGTSPPAAPSLPAPGRAPTLPVPPPTAPATPGGPRISPFAAADAEVFVSTALHARGSGVPPRKRSGAKRRQQQQQAGSTADGAAGGGQEQQQQQHQGGPGPWWRRIPFVPGRRHQVAGAPGGPVRGRQPSLPQHQPSLLLQQQASLQLLQGAGQQGGRRSSSRCPTPGGLRAAGRAVSVKPSFALPIADLKLPNRPKPAELLSSAQAILLLLVLLVQVVTLYDNLAIRRLLAASGPLAGHV